MKMKEMGQRYRACPAIHHSKKLYESSHLPKLLWPMLQHCRDMHSFSYPWSPPIALGFLKAHLTSKYIKYIQRSRKSSPSSRPWASSWLAHPDSKRPQLWFLFIALEMWTQSSAWAVNHWPQATQPASLLSWRMSNAPSTLRIPVHICHPQFPTGSHHHLIGLQWWLALFPCSYVAFCYWSGLLLTAES